MFKQLYLIVFFSVAYLFWQTAMAAEKLPVIVLNDANKFPFTTKNKDGFLDAVIIEMFKRVGYEVEMVKLPPERGLLSANQGVVDGEVNRIGGIEKSYKNLRRVAEPIRSSDFCVLSTNSKIVNNPESLSQHVVGYVKGWKIYEKMMLESTNVITANNPQQLFRLLKIGRIEAALYTCLQGAILSKNLDIKDIKVLQPQLTQRDMFVYLNKKHNHLVPALSKALQDIKREGLYDAWYKEKILPYILSSSH